MPSALKYHGGKHYLAKKILDQAPEHTHYLEPYCGACNVLFAKDPEGVSEAVNDSWRTVTNFWEVMGHDAAFELFKRQVEAVPFSDEFFSHAVGLVQHCERKQAAGAGFAMEDMISYAVAFFIVNRQSRQGLGKSYATPTKRTRRGMNENVSAWLSAVDGLADFHGRLRRVEIRNMDALDFLRTYDHEGAWFYCDPPYLHETRSAKDAYAHEMTYEQHNELLCVLSMIKGKFTLSGYPSELYNEHAESHGWYCEIVDIDNKSSSSKHKEKKQECLWRNYVPVCAE